MTSTSNIAKTLVVACIIARTFFISNKLSASSMDTLRYEKTVGLAKIPVQINGKTYQFIFDTGAQGTVLRSDKADEMGTNTGESDTLYDAFNNKTIQAFYNVGQLKVGESTITNLKTLVFPTNPVFECLGIDGIIGQDIIRQFDWLIDFDKRYIIKIDTSARYNEKLAGFKHVKFKMNDWKPTITLGIGSQNIDFLFDSGASSSDMAEDSYQSIKKQVISEFKNINSHAGGNTQEMISSGSKILLTTNPSIDATFQHLAYFNRTTVTMNKIGNPFWNNNQLFLSEGKQILAYKPTNTSPVADFDVMFKIQDGAMVVNTLTFNKQVEQYGLKVGDVVTSINGKSFTDNCELKTYVSRLESREMVLEMAGGKRVVLKRN